MDRRTIIKQISIMTGAAFIGGEIFIQSGCKSDESKLQPVSFFSKEQAALLDEIGETILPEICLMIVLLSMFTIKGFAS